MFEAANTTIVNDDDTDEFDGEIPAVESDIDGVFLELLEQFVGVPPVELNSQIGDLELQRRALDARTAAAIHLAEVSGAFAVDGHRTMTGFLKAKLNWSGKQVAKWLKVSQFVARHTAVGDAWAAGRIGFDQILELQKFWANPRARHMFDTLLPVLLLQAEQLLVKQFQIAVAHAIAKADEDGAHIDRDTAVEHRNAHVLLNGAELDVSVVGGDPVTAAEIVAIFDLAVQQEFDADVAARAAQFGDDAANHPLPRTAQQRRHDAFIRIFRAGGAAIANDATAGSQSVAKVVVRIVIDEETFRNILTDAGLAPAGLIRDAIGELVADPTGLLNRKCQLADGTPIHPHDALRALLSGYVQRVVIDANSVVTDMGRESRLFTGHSRQAAIVLATHCDHAGCDLPAEFCDIDHNIEWAAGGRTDQDNARPRCSTHNRFKSRNRWRSQQATNGHHYNIREDGTIVLPIGARPPTFAEPAPPVGRRCNDPRHHDLRFDDPRIYGYGPEDPAEVAHMNALIRQRVRAIRAA